MNYEPLVERDFAAIQSTVREFTASAGAEEAWKAIARFAVLAYAPSQHAKHALLCCLSAWETRDVLGPQFDQALIECAKYTAASRQPWSEPPMLDPPAVDDDQRGDAGELREAIENADRLRAERWLAKSFRDHDFAPDFFAVAADSFEDLGHPMIVTNAAWKLASLLGEKGRYAALRVGVWEMVADRGERYCERGVAPDAEVLASRLIENMEAERGSIESAHALFLLDAALECGQEERASHYLSELSLSPHSVLSTQHPALPIYRYARDCGEYLKAHAVASRLHSRFPSLPVDRIIAAAWHNLQHGPSFEDFSFA